MPQYRGQKVRYRRSGVLRLRLRQLLEARGLSAYGLAKFTGLSLNTIYRLTRPNGRFSLIRADTIERLYSNSSLGVTRRARGGATAGARLSAAGERPCRSRARLGRPRVCR